MTILNKPSSGTYTRFINVNQNLKINDLGNEIYSPGREKLSVRADFKSGINEIKIDHNIFNSVIDSSQPTFHFGVSSTRDGASCHMMSTIIIKEGDIFNEFASDKTQWIVLGVASKFDVKLTGLKNQIKNTQFDVINNFPRHAQNYDDQDQARLFEAVKALLDKAQKNKEIIELRAIHI